jgi:hypothetical protein
MPMISRIVTIVVISCLFFIPVDGIAQDIKPVRKELIVDFDERGELFFYHITEQGTGFKYISRLFRVEVSELLALNEIDLEYELKLHEVLKIPVKRELILDNIDHNIEDQSRYLPIYYLAKPKETLFRISKIYFLKEIQELKSLNPGLNENIQIGQRICIGWIPEFKTAGPHIPSLETKPISLKKDSIQINDLTIQVENTDIAQDWISAKAVAYWDKQANYTLDQKYVLHPSAKINSIIELYNPHLKTSASAKVIGRIPEGTYREDIHLVVSPSIAKSLGALDSRFMVQTRYTE